MTTDRIRGSTSKTKRTNKKTFKDTNSPSPPPKQLHHTVGTNEPSNQQSAHLGRSGVIPEAFDKGHSRRGKHRRVPFQQQLAHADGVRQRSRRYAQGQQKRYSLIIFMDNKEVSRWRLRSGTGGGARGGRLRSARLTQQQLSNRK